MTEPSDTPLDRAASPARVTDPHVLREVLSALASGPTTPERLVRLLQFRHDVRVALSHRPRILSLRQQLREILREFEHIEWLVLAGRGWQLRSDIAEMVAASSHSPQRLALALCLAHQRSNQQVISRLLGRMLQRDPQCQDGVTMDAASWPVSPSPDPPPSEPADHNTEPPARRRPSLDQLLDQTFGDICSPRDLRIWEARMDWAGLTMTAHSMPPVSQIRTPVWFCVGSFCSETSDDSTEIPELTRGGHPYHRRTPSGLSAERHFADILYLSYIEHLRTANTEFGPLLKIRDHVCFELRIGNDVFQALLQRTLIRTVSGDLPYLLALDVDATDAERRNSEASMPVIVDNSPRYLISMRRRPTTDRGGTKP